MVKFIYESVHLSVSVCVSGCLCVWVCRFKSMWRPEDHTECVSQSLSGLFLRQSFSLNLFELDWIDWRASKPWWSTCFSNTGITSMCCLAQIFCGYWEMELESSYLCRNHFINWAIPQPLNLWFKLHFFSLVATWRMFPCKVTSNTVRCSLNCLGERKRQFYMNHYTDLV